MKIEQKKGVSLIVLIITIVVMIILSAAIILSVTGNDIFGNAEDAVDETDRSNFIEAIQVEYMNWEVASNLRKTDKTAIEYIKDKLSATYSEEWLNQINITGSGEVILDSTDPNNAYIVLSATQTNISSNITARVLQSDNESGVNISKCKWIYTTSSEKLGTDESMYTGNFENADETINLSATVAGKYYLHVLTVDNVGRKTETVSEEITVTGSLSKFYVEDCDTLSYSVIENMSWQNFVNSSYNDGKFSIDTDGGTDNTGKNMIIQL